MTLPGRLQILALALSLAGCVGLRPLDEVRRAAEPGTTLEIDGVEVHLLDQGEGHPIVLIHGFGASSFSWRKVIPGLTEDHRILAIDLPGFGASERPRDLRVYERDRQVGLVVEILDRLGLERVHLIGHSFGGALAMTLAHEHPERLRDLVLVSAAAPDYPEARRHLLGDFPPAVFLWVRGVALRRPLVARVLRHSFSDDSLVDRPLVDAYRDRLRVEGAARAWRGLTRPLENPYVDVRYEAIPVPTLAIWGADDELIPPPEARAAVRQFPNARFVEIPECGHIPMEECPEPLVEKIRGFLDSRPTGRTARAEAR